MCFPSIATITTLKVALVYIFLIIVSPSSVVHADTTRTFHHEIWSGVRWFRETTEYTNYVINHEPNHLKSETFQKSPWQFTAAYTYFFTPLSGSDDVPWTLWDFYAHPTKARLYLHIQPKTEVTGTHHDPSLQYTRQTTTDEHSRTLGIEFEHYLAPHTGVFMHARTLRNDDDTHTFYRSSHSSTRAAGQHEGLRRIYGAGLSRYLSAHLRLRAGYSFLDGEFRHREKTWAEAEPHLVTQYYFDSELTGHIVFATGEYIVTPSISIKGTYELQTFTVQADYLPVYPKDLVGQPIVYDDDTTQHSIGASVNFYRGSKTTLEFGTTYRANTVERRYAEHNQAVDYSHYNIGIVIGTLHYFAPALGVRLRYELFRQFGDVRIWYPEEDASLQTTYDTRRHRHTLVLEVVGRF